MDFSKLYQKSSLPVLTSKERQRASILVVESDPSIRNRLRQTLISLDIGHISDAPDHITALKKIEERHFSHLLFETKKSNMPLKDFLQSAMEFDNRTIAIASSYEPTVDDVFDLLIMGARSFLVKPFTTESVDEAIIWASKGEPISDSILYAKNRNEALASLVLNSLGKLTVIMRQSHTFETARRELPKRQAALRRAVEIARMFAQGGEDALLEAMVEYSLARSEEPASRLGKVRKMLSRKGDRSEEDNSQQRLAQALINT